MLTLLFHRFESRRVFLDGRATRGTSELGRLVRTQYSRTLPSYRILKWGMDIIAPIAIIGSST